MHITPLNKILNTFHENKTRACLTMPDLPWQEVDAADTNVSMMVSCQLNTWLSIAKYQSQGKYTVHSQHKIEQAPL